MAGAAALETQLPTHDLRGWELVDSDVRLTQGAPLAAVPHLHPSLPVGGPTGEPHCGLCAACGWRCMVGRQSGARGWPANCAPVPSAALPCRQNPLPTRASPVQATPNNLLSIPIAGSGLPAKEQAERLASWRAQCPCRGSGEASQQRWQQCVRCATQQRCPAASQPLGTALLTHTQRCSLVASSAVNGAVVRDPRGVAQLAARCSRHAVAGLDAGTAERRVRQAVPIRQNEAEGAPRGLRPQLHLQAPVPVSQAARQPHRRDEGRPCGGQEW